MRCVDVIGYEGLYKVYDNGDIYSCISNKMLKQSKINSGYKFVCLYKNKEKKQKTVHRIVIESFLGFESMVVDHVDGDKNNNHLSNLEYCNQRENCRRYFKKTSSLPVGISVNKDRFEVHKFFNGKQLFIGSFGSLNKALRINKESDNMIDNGLKPKEYRAKDKSLRGIYFESAIKKWKVMKFINNKKIYLGSYHDFEDAKLALDEFNKKQSM